MPYILLSKQETHLLDNSRYLENYMTITCNAGTSKSNGMKSHITDNCLASKYPEFNDACISNHKNTLEARNRKALLKELDTQKKKEMMHS